MAKKSLAMLFVLSVTFISGCVHVSSQRNPKYNEPRTDPWDVIFLKGFPNHPHKQLGTISLEGGWTSWEKVLYRAREEAAEMGGTAIVILMSGERYDGTINLPGTYSSSTTGSASGSYSGYSTGNYAYGTVSATGQSTTKGTWTPGPSIAINKKVITGFVIKLKKMPKEEPADSTTNTSSENTSTSKTKLDKILGGIKMEKEKEQKMLDDWKNVSQLAVDESIPKDKRKELVKAYIEEYGDSNPFRDEAEKLLVPLDPVMLVIKTTPPGANIIINGTKYGESPITLEAIAGEYEVVASKDGYSEETRIVPVSHGDIKEVSIELKDKFGTLAVDSDPPNALISIGERKPTPAPITRRLQPGKYHLTATHEGYLDKETHVTIIAGKTKKFKVTFKEQIPGTVLVTTTPPEAEVIINAEKVGAAPITKQLQPGEYSVVASAKGFKPETRRVGIASGEKMEVSISLQRIYPMNPYKKWGHVAFWTGLGISMAGAGFALKAADAAEEHKAGDLDAADESRVMAGLFYTSMGLGVSLMATGVVLWILSPGDKEWFDGHETSVGVLPTDSGVTFTIGGRW